MPKLYSLFVGIGQYKGKVSSLPTGTEDALAFRRCIEAMYPHFDHHAKTLLELQATRSAIIDAIQNHLGRAEKEDVALFYFSGHGSRQLAAPEFARTFNEGMDETLLCYDSREPQGLDLADKELAALFQPIAAKGAHVVVVLDCCHADSGVRDAVIDGKMDGVWVKQASDRNEPRPLQDYLKGWFLRKKPMIPRNSMILLAACTRYELAGTSEELGLSFFTKALIQILRQSSGVVSYADLQALLNQSISTFTGTQHPVVHPYGAFNPYRSFLNVAPLRKPSRYRVWFDASTYSWKVNAGLKNGWVHEATKSIKLALYQSNDAEGRVFANAELREVHLSDATLEWDYPEIEKVYWAELRSVLPHRLLVAAELDSCFEALQCSMSECLFLQPVDRSISKFVIRSVNQQLRLEVPNGDLICGIEEASRASDACSEFILGVLQNIWRWEQLHRLHRTLSHLPHTSIDFELVLQEKQSDLKIASVGPQEHEQVRSIASGYRWQFRFRHRFPDTVRVVLLYFCENYEIQTLQNVPVEQSREWTSLYGEGADEGFYLPDGMDQLTERFKLVIGSEALNTFYPFQAGIPLGAMVKNADPQSETGLRGFTGMQKTPPVFRLNATDWVTLDVEVQVSRKRREKASWC